MTVFETVRIGDLALPNRLLMAPVDAVEIQCGQPLEAAGLDVRIVGDAGEPNQIMGAVKSAWQVACSI